jgi:hypothetical protein
MTKMRSHCKIMTILYDIIHCTVSLIKNSRSDDGLIEKRPKHVVSKQKLLTYLLHGAESVLRS